MPGVARQYTLNEQSAHREPVSYDVWRPHRAVAGAEAAILAAVRTQADLAAMDEIIDMGAYDCLDVLPLMSAAGAAAPVMELRGFAPGSAFAQHADGASKNGEKFLEVPLNQVTLGGVTAAVDLTGLFGSFVGATDFAFTTFTILAGGLPALTSTPGSIAAPQILGTAAGVGRLLYRLKGFRYARMVRIDAGAGTLRFLTRRFSEPTPIV